MAAAGWITAPAPSKRWAWDGTDGAPHEFWHVVDCLAPAWRRNWPSARHS